MTAARDRFKMFSFSVMQSTFCFSNMEILNTAIKFINAGFQLFGNNFALHP